MSTPQRPDEPDDNDHGNDGQGDAVEPAEPSRPGRTAYRRGTAWPNGSTNRLRADVLGALGVLKVATADQLQRLLRPGAASNTVIRQTLRDLALHGLVASDGNTKTGHKTWRLEGTAGLEAAGQVLGVPRSDMGSTARGAGRSGAQHAMAVNETVLAFVRGGTAPGAPGGVGTVADWATEVEFTLPGGKRKVRPDAVWQAPEIGVPVLMVEVDRSTMSPERVAAKFTAYRELFRVKVRDNDPALSGQEPADRTVHWWRRTWPGHTRPGYPPVALVVTDAGPVALANRQRAVADLARDAWGGTWWVYRPDNADGDGWRESSPTRRPPHSHGPHHRPRAPHRAARTAANPSPPDPGAPLNVTTSTLSLTVADIDASRDFLCTHLGYQVAVAAEGFVSLAREDAAADVVLLRTGSEVLPPEQRHQRAGGLILALTVAGGLAEEEQRLREAGTPITLPLREEPWGERLFQLTDPNGIVVQLVEWVTPGPPADGAAATAASAPPVPLVIAPSDGHVTESPNARMTGLAAPSRGSAELSTWTVAMTAGQTCPEHTVSREQVWTVTTGALEITHSGRTETVPTGHTLILPPGLVRRVHAPQDSEAHVAMRADGVAAVPGTAGTRALPWAQ